MTKKQLFEETAMILAGVFVAFLPPPAGLEPKAMTFLGIFLWAILNWVVTVLPAFIVGLLIMIANVLFHVVPFKVAFSSFSGTTVWLIIGVFILGSAVSKTGLLSRLCFAIMNVFPASFRGQVAGLLGAGYLIGPFMPSTTAKVSIAGGFSTRLAELLGFTPHSKGMNGMYLAMYTGFSLIAATFISSSFYSYLILGAIAPEDAAYFTFSTWFLAMLPWGIFTIICAYLAIVLMYAPSGAKKIDKEEIRQMSKELGPMSRNEKITLGILLLSICCFALERVIGVPAVLTSLIGMCALFVCKVLGPKDINSSLNWGVIILCASIIALAPMIQAVGINGWMEANLGSVMAAIGDDPYIFVASVAVLIILSRFVLVSGATAISIMVVILAPFCHAAGMSAWIGGIIAYTMAQPFFFKYQNPNMLIGFEAAGGDEKISFARLIPYCVVYHLIAAIGLLLSIPYWQYLGLIY